MSDPLANIVNNEDQAYGATKAMKVLYSAFQNLDAGGLAAATESFLKRLVILEMFLERDGVNISAEELDNFLATNSPEIDEETAKLSHLFYGKIATREGG
jgi:hypothetical protein